MFIRDVCFICYTCVFVSQCVWFLALSKSISRSSLSGNYNRLMKVVFAIMFSNLKKNHKFVNIIFFILKQYLLYIVFPLKKVFFQLKKYNCFILIQYCIVFSIYLYSHQKSCFSSHFKNIIVSSRPWSGAMRVSTNKNTIYPAKFL